MTYAYSGESRLYREYNCQCSTLCIEQFSNLKTHQIGTKLYFFPVYQFTVKQILSIIVCVISLIFKILEQRISSMHKNSKFDFTLYMISQSNFCIMYRIRQPIPSHTTLIAVPYVMIVMIYGFDMTILKYNYNKNKLCVIVTCVSTPELNLLQQFHFSGDSELSGPV